MKDEKKICPKCKAQMNIVKRKSVMLGNTMSTLQCPSCDYEIFYAISRQKAHEL